MCLQHRPSPGVQQQAALPAGTRAPPLKKHRTKGAGNKTKISPNPNYGTFVLSGKEYVSNDEISVQISNAMGQVVFENEIRANRNGEINDQIHLQPANEKGDKIHPCTFRSKRKSMSLKIDVE